MDQAMRPLTQQNGRAAGEAERLRPRRVFAPATDVVETDGQFVIIADMPGVDAQSVEITLEHDVLTVAGTPEPQRPQGHELAYAESEVGRYERAFTMPETIDRDGIRATVKDGTLTVTLAKADPAKMRKIAVTGA